MVRRKVLSLPRVLSLISTLLHLRKRVYRLHEYTLGRFNTDSRDMNTRWDYLAKIRLKDAIYQLNTKVERVECFYTIASIHHCPVKEVKGKTNARISYRGYSW